MQNQQSLNNKYDTLLCLLLIYNTVCLCYLHSNLFQSFIKKFSNLTQNFE